MNRSKIAALAVMSVFLLASVPVPAAAQEDLTEKDRQLREKYQVERDSYLKAKRTYLDARKDWQVFKPRFRERDKVAFAKGQNFLDKGTKHLIQYITVLSKKVDETKALDADQKAALTGELAGYIATLEADQAQINNASTVEELRAASEKVKADWDTIRPQVKRIIGEVLLAKAQLIVARAENASTKVDAKIADLKAKGKNTTELEAKSADYKAKIAAAKDKLAQAATKLGEVKTGDATVSLRGADQFIREANKTLRELHRSLGQIIRELKQIETGEEQPAPEDVNTTDSSTTPVDPEEVED